MKTKLYQLNTQNKMKVWTIEVRKYNSYSEIVVTSGQLNGRMIENITKISSGKNEGKSNETNHYTQAVAEMEATIKLQIRKGYVEDIKNAKNSAILGSGLPAPMLAQKYCGDGHQSGSKTLSQLGLTGKNIICQPKLDGNRCLIKIENGVAKMFTRKGDLMKVQLNHILNELNGFQDDVILDGELFSTEISFNTLNGLIKKETVTPEDIEKRKQIKFNLYDVMFDDGYEIRNQYIQQFKSNNILIVPSKTIVATDQNIQNELEKMLAEGHEGLILRQVGIGYENKRTWQLLKVKTFEDDEFELIGFEEESRGGFVGAFVCKHPKTGVICKPGSSGQSVEERKEMWLHQSKYIGRMVTVEYFGFSEYGIPRFPKMKGFRD